MQCLIWQSWAWTYSRSWHDYIGVIGLTPDPDMIILEYWLKAIVEFPMFLINIAKAIIIILNLMTQKKNQHLIHALI